MGREMNSFCFTATAVTTTTVFTATAVHTVVFYCYRGNTVEIYPFTAVILW